MPGWGQTFTILLMTMILSSIHNFPQEILDKVNTVLIERKKTSLSLNQIVFIMGMSLLSYGKGACMVSKSNLTDVAQFENVFSPLLEGGPDLVRAVLMPMEDNRYLIELFIGPPRGNPSPEIIGTPDLRRTVKVVEL